MTGRAARIGIPIAVGVLFLAGWQALVVGNDIRPYLLPKPTAIWEQMVHNRADILTTARVTGTNALVGLLAGAILGDPGRARRAPVPRRRLDAGALGRRGERDADHRAGADLQHHVLHHQLGAAAARGRAGRVLPAVHQRAAGAAPGRADPSGADGQLRGRRLDLRPARSASPALSRSSSPGCGWPPRSRSSPPWSPSTSAASRTGSAPGSPPPPRTPPTRGRGRTWPPRALSACSSTSSRPRSSGSRCRGTSLADTAPRRAAAVRTHLTPEEHSMRRTTMRKAVRGLSAGAAVVLLATACGT